MSILRLENYRCALWEAVYNKVGTRVASNAGVNTPGPQREKSFRDFLSALLVVGSAPKPP